jgi:hypothetical protein
LVFELRFMVHQQRTPCKRQRSMAIMPGVFLEVPGSFSKGGRHPHSLYGAGKNSADLVILNEVKDLARASSLPSLRIFSSCAPMSGAQW